MTLPGPKVRAALVAAAAVAWAAWIAGAPLLAAADSAAPQAWTAAVAYRAGSVICHQQDARSLHVAGVRMPVCARCAGLYAGGAAGALAALAWVSAARRSPRLRLGRARLGVVACAVPTLAAWALEHLGGVAVRGEMRAALAVPLGGAVAAIVTLWAGGASFEDAAAGSALHS